MFEFIVGWIFLLIVISLHESAHAWMADRLGDPTGRLAGRITLNPLAHIDPIGTVLLPLLMAFSGIPIFIGWAKPTPFDPFNLRNPKVDSAKIAFAGPASNLIFAVILSVIIRVLDISSAINFPIVYLLYTWLSLLLKVNVFLAVFNLVPIHPLDGFKVVGGFLSKEGYRSWLELERYGMIFLFLFLFPIFGSSPLLAFINPVINFILSILLPNSSNVLGGFI
ncbi:MAG: hypothetical protein UT63_C0044G0002 [Candidatus Gottesmanbacteria bacterium GW2011_GWC2_39_8]|uniref:Peptidase M50 n=1 Tax=Candidatus Gottesmanbacteria bacterium GW2011_GWC2_39_8 TaxID=1618450 RepID=A0A0G0SCG9_9BACT|nr:MAG: hypothetical protein UT63_C0044G0002 [Candidatus Gottesmanbacteria bacterium GW2011_GWC2_39_8]